MGTGHWAGWAFVPAQSGHCPLPILNVSKLEKHNLKILQILQDPSSYCYNLMQYVTGCDFALHFHLTYPDSLHFFSCWDSRNPIPSNNCPEPRSAIWSQQLLGEGHNASTSSSLPEPIPAPLQINPCNCFTTGWDFAQGFHLFIGIFHLNNFLMFYVARMPLPFKEGSMQ